MTNFFQSFSVCRDKWKLVSSNNDRPNRSCWRIVLCWIDIQVNTPTFSFCYKHFQHFLLKSLFSSPFYFFPKQLTCIFPSSRSLTFGWWRTEGKCEARTDYCPTTFPERFSSLTASKPSQCACCSLLLLQVWPIDRHWWQDSVREFKYNFIEKLLVCWV